jgi:hypothetical protein
MSMYLAQRDARLVVEAHESQDLRIAEPELGQPMQGDPRQAEQHVAGVDRLRDAVDRPERRPMAPFAVAILDVIVDEAEVVAELDGRGAGKRGSVVTRDRGVRQESQQGPDPLAGRRVLVVEAEVVANHLVDAGSRGLGARPDDAQDLRLRVGDERRQVELARHRGHLPGV